MISGNVAADVVALTVMAADRIPFSDDIGDDVLINGVRENDVIACEALVRRHHRSLVRMARLYVSNDATAADVAQDTWLAALAGLDRFEGRASFRTWLYRILVNQARRRGARDARQIPFSSTTRLVDDPYNGAVDPERLKPGSDLVEPLHWRTVPSLWELAPEQQALSTELRHALDAAIDTLSSAQQEVITLIDILGWEPSETAAALGITETNQRVLLHRARVGVRNHLEEYLTT